MNLRYLIAGILFLALGLYGFRVRMARRSGKHHRDGRLWGDALAGRQLEAAAPFWFAFIGVGAVVVLLALFYS